VNVSAAHVFWDAECANVLFLLFLGVWALAGVVIRLAMRMGYHRDPMAYPELSALQGEMRRRIWTAMINLDALMSVSLLSVISDISSTN
jgi:hypothetical protein